MADGEIYKPAFDGPPGTVLAGLPDLNLPMPYTSRGLTYYDACAKHVRETFKVYIVASRSLAANTDSVDKLVAALGADRVVGIRKGISPHSPLSEILEITKECKDKEADCVVTLGAGSITDGCKLVVFALANSITTIDQLLQYSYESTNPPADMKEPTVSLITIPTSLSEGEYFSLAGGTDDRNNHKTGFLHSGMGARLIILDPQLCLTTPEYHWLSTGVRSLDHCVEALCSLEATADSDERAKQGLELLAPNLLRCKADSKDVEARRQCQLGVRYAMENVRAGIPLGGSHAIGHMLGPLGAPHGITSCIMCPAVMRYNLEHGSHNREISLRQEKVRRILWSQELVGQTLREAGIEEGSAGLSEMLDVVIRALGMPRTLQEVGVGRDVIPALSERALADFWAKTNPVPLLRAEQVQEILESVA